MREREREGERGRERGREKKGSGRKNENSSPSQQFLTMEKEFWTLSADTPVNDALLSHHDRSGLASRTSEMKLSAVSKVWGWVLILLQSKPALMPFWNSEQGTETL